MLVSDMAAGQRREGEAHNGSTHASTEHKRRLLRSMTTHSSTLCLPPGPWVRMSRMSVRASRGGAGRRTSVVPRTPLHTPSFFADGHSGLALHHHNLQQPWCAVPCLLCSHTLRIHVCRLPAVPVRLLPPHLLVCGCL